jgi:TubC N-terminal docking domain
MSAAELLHQLSRLGVAATATPDGFLDLEPAEILTPELLETIKANKAELLEHLMTTNTGMVARLPWQLEALIHAASNDTLPSGSVRLESGLVPDLSRYVLAWAGGYLTGGDREDCLERLWAAWRYWRTQIERTMN